MNVKSHNYIYLPQDHLQTLTLTNTHTIALQGIPMNIYIWDKERDQLRVLTTHNHILHNSDYLQLEVFNIFFILLNIMNIKITRTEKI